MELIFLIFLKIFLGNTRAEVTRQRLTMPTYIVLYTPAFEWILHGVVLGSTDYTLDEIVLKSQEQKNCSFIFHAILTTFPKRFIAMRSLHFANIVCKCDSEAYTKSQLLRALGSCLSDTPPPTDQMKDVFNYVWRIIGTFTQIQEYLTCIETWIPFIAENLTVSIILYQSKLYYSRNGISQRVHLVFFWFSINSFETTLKHCEQVAKSNVNCAIVMQQRNG